MVVWQKGMDFAYNCLQIPESIDGHYRLCEQLEASSASISQKIAEGNGRVSTKGFIHFLYISRGSLYESIALINLLERRGLIDKSRLKELESLGLEIVKMLNSFISQQRDFL